jgi:hypothetical protein
LAIGNPYVLRRRQRPFRLLNGRTIWYVCTCDGQVRGLRGPPSSLRDSDAAVCGSGLCIIEYRRTIPLLQILQSSQAFKKNCCRLHNFLLMIYHVFTDRFERNSW